MIQIIPAILSKTEEDFEKDINKIKNSTALKDGWVHIDFMDNIFVPNKSINPLVLAKYEIPFKKEAHPMVAYPLEWVNKLVEVGFDRIIFHIEAKDDPDEWIESIKKAGLRVGIAINSDTPVEKLEPYVDKIDVILVMAIVPGFQEQPFIPESLEKIRQLKSKNWPVKIAVDGAVNDKNAKKLVEAGADHLTVGSFLLKGDVDDNMEIIWEAINN